MDIKYLQKGPSAIRGRRKTITEIYNAYPLHLTVIKIKGKEIIEEKEPLPPHSPHTLNPFRSVFDSYLLSTSPQ